MLVSLLIHVKIFGFVLHPDISREEALNMLRSKRRERLAFERATVWRDMVIYILLAVFSTASALSKYGVTKDLATALLKRSSRKPKYIVLVFMTLAVIASMFISNVAASVLCFGLLGPILRTVQSGSPLKALILGIAYAANIGGLTTSIASPQNVVTFDQLYESPINFFTLLLFSLPIAIVSLFASWFVLLLIYKMENKDIELFLMPMK